MAALSIVLSNEQEAFHFAGEQSLGRLSVGNSQGCSQADITGISKFQTKRADTLAEGILNKVPSPAKKPN